MTFANNSVHHAFMFWSCMQGPAKYTMVCFVGATVSTTVLVTARSLDASCWMVRIAPTARSCPLPGLDELGSLLCLCLLSGDGSTPPSAPTEQPFSAAVHEPLAQKQESLSPPYSTEEVSRAAT